MNSEEKLEQSTIVKEQGTVYFKVSQQSQDSPSEGCGGSALSLQSLPTISLSPLILTGKGRGQERSHGHRSFTVYWV